MAIGRVAGPMLLTDLDRQGLDLQFSTNGNPLVYLDFTNFKMSLNSPTDAAIPYTFNVTGNASIGNVVLQNGGIITTQLLNQNLRLQASGTGNVTVTNANVISGSISSTVIGAINPRAGTFTYLQSNLMATLATANIGNLKSNRVVFTKSDNSQLVDDDLFQFFQSNSTLRVGALVTVQQQAFDTLSAGNLVLRSATQNQIPYFASNSLALGSNAFTFTGGFSASPGPSANLLTTGNLSLFQANPGQVLFVDQYDGNKVKGTSHLLYDGFNLTADGISRFDNITISGQQIYTPPGSGVDLQLISDTNVISVQNNYIRDLNPPVQQTDAATKGYVDGIIFVNSQNTRQIYQGSYPGSVVRVSDDDLGTANVVVTVQGLEYLRLANSFANVFSITMNSQNEIGTKAGALYLQPANNNRVVVTSNSALTIPSGSEAERPVTAYTGDFRFNSEIGTIEWFDGQIWENPANNVVYSQSITPTGSTNTFTLTQPATTASILVNFNGVIQAPGTTYSVSGNTISFTSVPLTSDQIEVRFFSGTISHATNPITVDVNYTTVGTSYTTLDDFSAFNFRAVRYGFVAKSASTGNYETGELHVVHDGVKVYYNTYGVAVTAGWLNWAVTIDGLSVVRVQAQGPAADTKVKLHRLYYTDV
jgi:hypothetical protein